MRTLAALATGRVRLGSRAPVADLPTWVTLEVLRGGFATGSALAEGPLEPDEVALAQRLGLPPERNLLFAHHLTEDGLQDLYRLLDDGTYRVVLPEDAALPVLAWLARHGHREAALDLLDEIAPLASRLRFVPRRSGVPAEPPDHVSRATAGQAQALLHARRPAQQVEAQREAVTVWNPFADRMLALWWGRRADLDVVAAPASWRDEAERLLGEYDSLAAAHTRCTKHRRPKENLAVLLAAARDAVAGRPLGPRRTGLLRVVMRNMVAARGEPGTDVLAEARTAQEESVRRPSHAALARTAAARLDAVEPALGLREPEAFAGPVSAAEATAEVPEGAVMPEVVGRTLERSRSAPVEVLIETGVVPSAEVLGGLIPALSAAVVAQGYADETLARVVAQTYTAFRRRRSLLLVDLAKQVQLHELPWVAALEPFATRRVDEQLAVARRVAALALDHFPGTLLPNPLVRELDLLLRGTAVDVPLVEELAADIFLGTFSPKFARAADLARILLGDALYVRYFDLDHGGGMLETADRQERSRQSRRARDRADAFASLCHQRAGRHEAEPFSVAANGTVIEQAQVLTTHNLAALVVAGTRPTRSWTELADLALERCWDLLRLAEQQPRPLSSVKDAAYAWRQALFFASMAEPGEADAWALAVAPPRPEPRAAQALLAGLWHVAAKGRFDTSGRGGGGRRFYGWDARAGMGARRARRSGLIRQPLSGAVNTRWWSWVQRSGMRVPHEGPPTANC